MEKINNGNYDDAIRKGWVSSITEELKDNIRELPQSIRFETYKAIDKLVKEKMLELIIQRRVELTESGAERVYNPSTGSSHYEEEINIEEIINKSVEFVVKEQL